MLVYFARPIDQAGGGTTSWYGSLLLDIQGRLAVAGIGTFRPADAYTANIGNQRHTYFVNEINNHALYLADALIAFLPMGVPTLGTPVEIQQALILNKPVVVFTDIPGSVQLAAWEDRGVTVVNLSDPDTKIPEADDLKAMLRNKPDPGEDLISVGGGEPPLLVHRDGAANLQPGKYVGDAGIDLAISETTAVPAGDYALVNTGVTVAIPDGFFGWITGRSSTWARYRCNVRTAVIDSGYRGPLMLGIENHRPYAQTLTAGLRLGQLVLLPTFAGGIEVVNELPESERAENGYGSSGH